MLHLVLVVWWAGVLVLHGSSGCSHSRLLGRCLDVRVLPGSGGPFLLSFGHAGPTAAVGIMNPGEGNEGQRGHGSEHDSRDQHDQCNQNIIAEEGDGRQPTTYSPSWDAYALDDADANLGHEHKEEQHEVEGAVSLKCLVDGPEPTNVRARSEHEEPDDGHAEVGHSTSTKHPNKTADEIHSKCSTIQHPQVVHFLAHAAVLLRDLLEVLIKTWLEWNESGQRGEVGLSHVDCSVGSACLIYASFCLFSLLQRAAAPPVRSAPRWMLHLPARTGS